MFDALDGEALLCHSLILHYQHTAFPEMNVRAKVLVPFRTKWTRHAVERGVTDCFSRKTTPFEYRSSEMLGSTHRHSSYAPANNLFFRNLSRGCLQTGMFFVMNQLEAPERGQQRGKDTTKKNCKGKR